MKANKHKISKITEDDNSFFLHTQIKISKNELNKDFHSLLSYIKLSNLENINIYYYNNEYDISIVNKSYDEVTYES